MKAAIGILLVVGVALAGALVSPCRFSGGGKPVRVSGDFNAISAALRMYQSNTGQFPTTSQGLDALVIKPITELELLGWRKLLDEVPKDPWQKEYRYEYLTESEGRLSFELRSAGPDGEFDNEDDLSSLDSE